MSTMSRIPILSSLRFVALVILISCDGKRVREIFSAGARSAASERRDSSSSSRALDIASNSPVAALLKVLNPALAFQISRAGSHAWMHSRMGRRAQMEPRMDSAEETVDGASSADESSFAASLAAESRAEVEAALSIPTLTDNGLRRLNRKTTWNMRIDLKPEGAKTSVPVAVVMRFIESNSKYFDDDLDPKGQASCESCVPEGVVALGSGGYKLGERPNDGGFEAVFKALKTFVDQKIDYAYVAMQLYLDRPVEVDGITIPEGDMLVRVGYFEDPRAGQILLGDGKVFMKDEGCIGTVTFPDTARYIEADHYFRTGLEKA